MGDRRHSRAASVRGKLAVLLLLSTLVAPFAQPRAAAHGDEVPGQPSPQRLIAEDLQAGRLDYGTSLLYRAYAQFGDARLPDRFVGSTDSGNHDDQNLFLEARRFWNDLSPRVREQLTPFMLRPTAAGSVYARAGGVYSLASVPKDEADAGGCQDGWATAGSTVNPDGFKVWVQCTGDYAGDLERTVELIDSFWQDEVDLMSTGPKPDEGGGDPRLDFYLVGGEVDQLPAGSDRVNPMTADALAYAVPDEPFAGKTSSAYVVARRSRLTAPGFPLDLGHEFYHTLQFAHNVEIGYGFLDKPFGDFDILQLRSYWFIEAMAVWLESYEFRGRMPAGVMAAEVHDRFALVFQNSDLPLDESPDRASPEFRHMYAAYIWFFFMEQEVGPEAVASIWTDLEQVDQDDFAGAMRVIDSKLPFKDHFRDFAVRNLNLDLEPGDPIDPSYVDLDPAFPEGVRPTLKVGQSGTGKLAVQGAEDPPRSFDELLQSLVAHYYLFIPDPDATKFTLDFSGLGHRDALDVDAVVRLGDGTWERRKLSTDGPVTFCRANPEDDVERLYVILSNHDMDFATTVSGQFTTRVLDSPCA
jgi:hypothetical protein